MADKYNLDEEDKFIEFIFDGNKYQLWYPTTEEVLEIGQGKDNEEYEKFLMSQIKKPEGATYPDFEKVKGKMNVKQMMKFQKMLSTELGLDEG